MPSDLTVAIWWFVGVGGSLFALGVLGCLIRDGVRYHRDSKAINQRLQAVLKGRG